MCRRIESWEISRELVFFCKRICEHYNDHRPDAPRLQWSLETKWDLIKHDVSSFCGIYGQMLRLNKSGTSAADTLRRSRELYWHKNANKADFAFEHCWHLLKDHPKWADGWAASKAPPHDARTCGIRQGGQQPTHEGDRE